MANLAEISVSDIETRRGAKGLLTTSFVAIYTLSANAAPEVVDIALANVDGSNAATVSLVLAATGETDSTGTPIATAESLAAKTRVKITGIPLSPGDSIFGLAGSVDDIHYIISVQRERTGETAH